MANFLQATGRFLTGQTHAQNFRTQAEEGVNNLHKKVPNLADSMRTNINRVFFGETPPEITTAYQAATSLLGTLDKGGDVEEACIFELYKALDTLYSQSEKFFPGICEVEPEQLEPLKVCVKILKKCVSISSCSSSSSSLLPLSSSSSSTIDVIDDEDKESSTSSSNMTTTSTYHFNREVFTGQAERLMSFLKETQSLLFNQRTLLDNLNSKVVDVVMPRMIRAASDALRHQLGMKPLPPPGKTPRSSSSSSSSSEIPNVGEHKSSSLESVERAIPSKEAGSLLEGLGRAIQNGLGLSASYVAEYLLNGFKRQAEGEQNVAIVESIQGILESIKEARGDASTLSTVLVTAGQQFSSLHGFILGWKVPDIGEENVDHDEVTKSLMELQDAGKDSLENTDLEQAKQTTDDLVASFKNQFYGSTLKRLVQWFRENFNEGKRDVIEGFVKNSIQNYTHFLENLGGAFDSVARLPGSERTTGVDTLVSRQLRDHHNVSQQGIKYTQAEIHKAMAEYVAEIIPDVINWSEDIFQGIEAKIENKAAQMIVKALVYLFVLPFVLFPQWIMNLIIRSQIKSKLPELFEKVAFPEASSSNVSDGGEVSPLQIGVLEALDILLGKIYVIQESSNKEGGVSRSPGEHPEVRAFVVNLLETTYKSECDSVNELQNYVEGKDKKKNLLKSIEELFKGDIVNSIVDLLAVATTSLTDPCLIESILQTLLKGMQKGARTYTQEELHVLQRRIAFKTEAIANLSINHAVNQRFDFSVKRRKEIADQLVDKLKEMIKAFLTKVEKEWSSDGDVSFLHKDFAQQLTEHVKKIQSYPPYLVHESTKNALIRQVLSLKENHPELIEISASSKILSHSTPGLPSLDFAAWIKDLSYLPFANSELMNMEWFLQIVKTYVRSFVKQRLDHVQILLGAKEYNFCYGIWNQMLGIPIAEMQPLFKSILDGSTHG